MKVTNIALILSYFFLIIFLVIFIMLKKDIDVKMITNVYKSKVDLALQGCMTSKINNLSDKDMNNLAINNDLDIVLNHDKMYEKFIRLLKINFSLDLSNNLDIESYVDKFVVVENDGLYIRKNNKNMNVITEDYDNYDNNTYENSIYENNTLLEPFNNNIWEEKIPYTINKDGKYNSFNLNDDESMMTTDEVRLKQMAVISTIRRNIITYNKLNNKTIFINVPYENNDYYRSIRNRSVIVTLKNCPVANDINIDIVCFTSSELKRKNVYYINENNRYEKINYKNVNSMLEWLRTKEEAAMNYCPELFI